MHKREMEGKGESPSARNKVRGSELAHFLHAIRSSGVKADQLMFLCIGTDRSTGDALGPLVGTMLKEAGYSQVLGTLECPLDASNLQPRLEELKELRSKQGGWKVIAIDACLGQLSSIGSYQVSNQPIEPGKSVGRMLPHVGDYSIAAIVNVNSGNQYALLQSTPLHRVMTMAKEIVIAIQTVFPFESISVYPEVEL